MIAFLALTYHIHILQLLAQVLFRTRSHKSRKRRPLSILRLYLLVIDAADTIPLFFFLGILYFCPRVGNPYKDKPPRQGCKRGLQVLITPHFYPPTWLALAHNAFY